MEILQAIWTALTTENEILTKIITSFLMFIELLISTLLFTSILRINSTTKQKLLYVLSLSLIGIITLWAIPTPYNTFVNLIACPILVYFIYKPSILKCILSEIIPYVIFILLGSFLINIYLLIFNISAEAALTVPIHKAFYSLILYVFAYSIYLFCKHFSININIFNNMGKKNALILLVNLLVGIIALAIQSYLATAYANSLSFTISIISISILLAYFLISMYSLARTNKLEETAENLEQERLYNKTITILYDNIRGFKHDFNNIVQSIGGYISVKNIDGLKEYYYDLMEDCQKLNNLSILNPKLINNPALYSLLTSKYHTAEELNIKTSFEIFMDMSNLNIKTYDLTRILGILLDNAIDASKDSKEKEINIIIRNDDKTNRHLFVIENSFINKDVNIDKIFEKGYSSKTNNKNHGLGLWEIRQILKRNDNLNLFTTKDDTMFKQQLEIYF